MDTEPSAGLAAERFTKLRKLFLRDGEKDLLDTLEETLTAAKRYVMAVVRAESMLQRARILHPDDPQMFRSLLGPLDEARRTAHNALISALSAFNRRAGEQCGWEPEGRIPVGGVFTLDPEILAQPQLRRAEIGDWSSLLVFGLWEQEHSGQGNDLHEDPTWLHTRDSGLYAQLACAGAAWICAKDDRNAAASEFGGLFQQYNAMATSEGRIPILAKDQAFFASGTTKNVFRNRAR